MRRQPATSQQFIASVRWRMMLIRILESIGIACAVASAAGLSLLPIFWMRNQSGLTLAEAALILAAICGLMWGISARPTPLEVATEADKQLKLDDLLATLLSIHRQPSNDFTTPQWMRTLEAIADQKCQGVKPSSIIAARFGLRGWGAMGASAGLLITLAMLTSTQNPRSVIASEPAEPASIANNIHQSAEVTANNPTPAARPAGTSPLTEDSNRAADPETNDASPAAKQGSIPKNLPGPSGQTTGAGSGTAVTHAEVNSPKPVFQGNGSTDRAVGGTVSTGNGPANTAGDAAQAAGGSVAPHSSANRPAPWISPDWPANSVAPNTAVRAGSIPDEDADLIRDYFKRD